MLFEYIRGKLDLDVGEERYTLFLDRCFSACVGLSVRRAQAVRRLRTILKPFVPKVVDDPWSIDVKAEAIPETSALLDAAAEALVQVAVQPLTARQVLSALPITNRERLRWTKDGRLKRAGSASIHRGHLISIPTYDAAHVEMLLRDPGMISEWRRSSEACC